MVELEKLLKRLRTAEKKGDLDKLDETRAKIIDQHGDSPDAVEARYKLGLSKLLRHREPQAAEQLFLEATRGQDPLFAAMARISYALMLHAQKKEQKALFELRKVVGSRKPSPQSALALAFIVTILRDTGAKAAEVKRVRAQQMEHIETLLGETEEAAARAQLLLQLGLARVDQRESGPAREALEQAVELSFEVDPAVHEEAKAALQAMKKK